MVTPICAEVYPWSAVDHQRSLIGDPVKEMDWTEVHSSCRVGARKLKIQIIPPPRPTPSPEQGRRSGNPVQDDEQDAAVENP